MKFIFQHSMKTNSLFILYIFNSLTHICQNPFLDKRDLFTAIQSNKPEEVIAYTSLIEHKQRKNGLKRALCITKKCKNPESL